MKEESRTKKTVKNTLSSFIFQILNKVIMFIVRTVFIIYLNEEYLGINGLFLNILSILSFAEMGLGTAIIYKMYKPIAVNDKDKIKSLMRFYKKAYNTIGIIIFCLGLCVIPFLNFIVKDVEKINENISLLYVLFLINTSISYFFTYKKSIIIANQKEVIINFIDFFFYLFKSIFEIIFLVITRNYILFLVIEIVTTFLENLFISFKADKMYPYLKEKDVVKLSKEESKDIISNVKALVIYKFGSVVMNSTDNILISTLINVATVGLCSNYVMIINALKTILHTSLNSVAASIGNLNVTSSSEKSENVFYQYLFIYYIFSSICTIAFIILLNPFISMWAGSNYVLNFSVSLFLSLNFYIDCLRQPGYIYRTTMGLFEKSKITPYIGAISNIILSILFCKLWGLTGIFVATTVSLLISYSWIDPFLIHKYVFKTSFSKYLKKSLVYILVFVLCFGLCFYLTSLLSFSGWIGLILKGLIILVVTSLINLIVFCKMKEFVALKNKFLLPIIKKFKRA